MKKKPKVIDTNIFIKYFRGDPEVADFLAELENKCTTTVNILELYKGSRTRGRRGIDEVKTYLVLEKIKCLPITIKASKIALNLMERYAVLGLETKDSLIAGVCLSKNLELITEDKHFDSLQQEGLKIIKWDFDNEKSINFNAR